MIRALQSSCGRIPSRRHQRSTSGAFIYSAQPHRPANYALRRTALDNAGKFSPLAINAITRSFYVDDLLLSVDTETAISLAHELLAVVGSAGFQLTKWVSNCQAVLDAISQESGLTTAVNLDLDDAPVCRTLGIQWDVKYDCLVDASKTPPVADTKRVNFVYH